MNPHEPAPEHHQNILELYRQGWTQTQIAKALGFSRRTVYNHIHHRVFLPGKYRGRPRGSRKLSPFESQIRSRLELQPRLSMGQLLADLRSQGYRGGLSILRDFCRSLNRTESVKSAPISSVSHDLPPIQTTEMATVSTLVG